MSSPMSELSDLYGLAGKRALVTGPTSGIGLAIARLFADAGAELVLAGNDAQACAELADELAALSLPTDVGNPAELQQLADKCGPVDVLVCNAGVSGPTGPMHEMDVDECSQLYAVNLAHPARLTSMLAPTMAERGGGSIILLSSIAGLRGNASIGHYGITKAGISQLARNLAVEWGPHGLRANAIAPGLIDTLWSQAILTNPEAASRRIGQTPLRRLGQAEEVAATALFLASKAGAFITGQTIVVDGGTLISDGN